MLEMLRNFFRGDNLLDQAWGEMVESLGIDLEMFTAARKSLRESDSAELPFDIYEKDRRINKFQRAVRRKVITHLSVSGARDATPVLVLTSVVIDVERIGDYTKNITELAEAHPGRLLAGKYEEDLQIIESFAERSFSTLQSALETGDAKAARGHMAEYGNVARRADEIIEDLLTGADELPKVDAVTLALYLRYLKRICAHLNNIASSVVNPFYRIGFRSKAKESAKP